MVESAIPAAMTAPLSESVMQFIYLYVFNKLIDPIVGSVLCMFALAKRFFSIFSFRIGSKCGRGIYGS